MGCKQQGNHVGRGQERDVVIDISSTETFRKIYRETSWYYDLTTASLGASTQAFLSIKIRHVTLQLTYFDEGVIKQDCSDFGLSKELGSFHGRGHVLSAFEVAS